MAVSAPRSADARAAPARSSPWTGPAPVPLYFQLAQQLEAAIEHGALTPGSLLGNEIELAGTARPVPAHRPPGHPVAGRQGPAGAPPGRRHPGRAQPGQAPAGAEQPLRRPGGGRPAPRHPGAASTPSAGVRRGRGRTRGGRGQPRSPWCERLRLRARRADGVPVQLPAVRAARPATPSELETTGLYRLMRAAGITLHSARQSVGARAATAAEAGLLAEPPGAPLLTMRAHHLRRHAAGRSSTAPTSTGPRATPSNSSCSSAPEPLPRAVTRRTAPPCGCAGSRTP